MIFKEVFLFLPFRWTDVTKVETSNNLIAPDTICVTTRESSYHLGIFIHGKSADAFDVMSQLADMAMRRLMDADGAAASGASVSSGKGKDKLESILNRPQPKRRPSIHNRMSKNSSALKRNLYASRVCEEYRLKFNVPRSEKLDGRVREYYS